MGVMASILNCGPVKEQDLISSALTSLPWTDPSHRLSKDFLLLTVHATLQVWDTCLHRGLLSPRLSPLTLMFGNASFSPMILSTKFLAWSQRANPQLSQALSGRTLINLSCLVPTCHNPSSAWLENRQLQHYLSKSSFIDFLMRPDTDFESFPITPYLKSTVFC